VPPLPGTFGVWQVLRERGVPFGYVLSRAELGGIVYHCYVRGRDDAGGCPGYADRAALNSAVASMIQHEAELSALTGQLHLELDEWPS